MLQQAAVLVRVCVQICSFILLAHWMACSFFSLSLAEGGDERWTSFFGIDDQRVWTQVHFLSLTSTARTLTPTLHRVGLGSEPPQTASRRFGFRRPMEPSANQGSPILDEPTLER